MAIVTGERPVAPQSEGSKGPRPPDGGQGDGNDKAPHPISLVVSKTLRFFKQGGKPAAARMDALASGSMVHAVPQADTAYVETAPLPRVDQYRSQYGGLSIADKPIPVAIDPQKAADLADKIQAYTARPLASGEPAAAVVEPPVVAKPVSEPANAIDTDLDSLDANRPEEPVNTEPPADANASLADIDAQIDEGSVVRDPTGSLEPVDYSSIKPPIYSEVGVAGPVEVSPTRDVTPEEWDAIQAHPPTEQDDNNPPAGSADSPLPHDEGPVVVDEKKLKQDQPDNARAKKMFEAVGTTHGTIDPARKLDESHVLEAERADIQRTMEEYQHAQGTELYNQSLLEVKSDGTLKGNENSQEFLERAAFARYMGKLREQVQSKAPDLEGDTTFVDDLTHKMAIGDSVGVEQAAATHRENAEQAKKNAQIESDRQEMVKHTSDLVDGVFGNTGTRYPNREFSLYDVRPKGLEETDADYQVVVEQAKTDFNAHLGSTRIEFTRLEADPEYQKFVLEVENEFRDNPGKSQADRAKTQEALTRYFQSKFNTVHGLPEQTAPAEGFIGPVDPGLPADARFGPDATPVAEAPVTAAAGEAPGIPTDASAPVEQVVAAAGVVPEAAGAQAPEPVAKKPRRRGTARPAATEQVAGTAAVAEGVAGEGAGGSAAEVPAATAETTANGAPETSDQKIQRLETRIQDLEKNEKAIGEVIKRALEDPASFLEAIKHAADIAAGKAKKEDVLSEKVDSAFKSILILLAALGIKIFSETTG